MESERVLEAYVGEYASGKSEISINRALELLGQGRTVTLVDLDTVEPFYTLRSLKPELVAKGLQVISFDREDAFGLGETGAMLNPQARWALRRSGDIVLDVGYGVYGARTLNLVEGAYESQELKVLAVINYSRPLTGTPDRIREYVLDLGRVDGIVANTHLGSETTVEIIEEGNNEIVHVARELGIPVDFIAVDERFYPMEVNVSGIPIKYIHRYMPAAMW
ncbi:MAG: hypothetical protein ACM3PE_04880 [Deltaproteobacteria bacterium]